MPRAGHLRRKRFAGRSEAESASDRSRVEKGGQQRRDDHGAAGAQPSFSGQRERRDWRISKDRGDDQSGGAGDGRPVAGAAGRGKVAPNSSLSDCIATKNTGTKNTASNVEPIMP